MLHSQLPMVGGCESQTAATCGTRSLSWLIRLQKPWRWLIRWQKPWRPSMAARSSPPPLPPRFAGWSPPPRLLSRSWLSLQRRRIRRSAVWKLRTPPFGRPRGLRPRWLATLALAEPWSSPVSPEPTERGSGCTLRGGRPSEITSTLLSALPMITPRRLPPDGRQRRPTSNPQRGGFERKLPSPLTWTGAHKYVWKVRFLHHVLIHS